MNPVPPPSTSSPIRPGWYPHPEHEHIERYWDGERWSGAHRFHAERTQTAGNALVDASPQEPEGMPAAVLAGSMGPVATFLCFAAGLVFVAVVVAIMVTAVIRSFEAHSFF